MNRALDGDRTMRGWVDARQHPEQAGFARPVAANEPETVAVPKLEIHAIERPDHHRPVMGGQPPAKRLKDPQLEG